MNGGNRVRPGRPLPPGTEQHWRTAQRRRRAVERRRAPMSRRGRGTLAALAALLALGASSLALESGHGGTPPPEPSTPPVSAAPRPIASTPEVPAAVLERLPVTPSALELPVAGGPEGGPSAAGEEGAKGRLYEWVTVPGAADLAQPLRIEYTLEAELTREVFRLLRRGRAQLGHVVLLDPENGRVLAYASTDAARFPATRAYPAASLVKVITAAAALDRDPETARLPCRYRGSPYRLTPSRLDPPSLGKTVSLRKALAMSNNQCFAQLAVHAVGGDALLAAIDRFGWLAEPAPGHAAGAAEVGEDRYDVGRLGCGLAGCRITPLHAVQLAAALDRGELVSPRWIERVHDAHGRELPLPSYAAPRQVMTPELAGELRAMLVDTTRKGTARRAFRKRNGQPRLGPVAVAGKTGSLSGHDPDGRYEWFIGVAPADEPRIAIAVLMVQGRLWWRTASQLAADVLESVFCERGRCDAQAVARFTAGPPPGAADPTLAEAAPPH